MASVKRRVSRAGAMSDRMSGDLPLVDFPRDAMSD